MKKLIIIFIVLALLMPTFAMAQEPTKHAIIVAYDGSRSSKIWATTCGRLLKTVLREYGYSNQEITLLYGKKATWSNIEEAVSKVKDVDEFVIAFFGHGSATHFCIRLMCLPHSYINDLLSDLKSQKQLVIIDTCGSAGAILPGKDGVSLNATNRIVLTSTVFEEETSIFTWHLTDWSRAVLQYGLLEGNADFNGDGRVSIQEAGSVKGLISDNYGEEFFL